jgi:hypothetical protein
VGGKLRVTVRDPGRNPLQNAQVNAARRLPDGNFVYEYWAQTDKDGIASFAAMADGTWTIFANHQGTVQENAVVSVGGGVEAELEMTLRIGGSVLVHARDAGGAPVEGARVAFLDADSGAEIQPDWGRIWQRAWQENGGRNVDWNRLQHDATHTDAQGRLLREALKPGRVRVVLSKEGLRSAAGTAEVQDGYEIDLALAFEPPEGSATAGAGGGDDGAADGGVVEVLDE